MHNSLLYDLSRDGACHNH